MASGLVHAEAKHAELRVDHGNSNAPLHVCNMDTFGGRVHGSGSWQSHLQHGGTTIDITEQLTAGACMSHSCTHICPGPGSFE